MTLKLADAISHHHQLLKLPIPFLAAGSVVSAGMWCSNGLSAADRGSLGVKGVDVSAVSTTSSIFPGLGEIGVLLPFLLWL